MQFKTVKVILILYIPIFVKTMFRNTFNVSKTTVNDIDAPTAISGTFTQVGNEIRKFTWTTVTVA